MREASIHSADRYVIFGASGVRAGYTALAMLSPARVPLIVATLTTLVVTAAAWLVPAEYAGSIVGLMFCGVTYWMVLRKDTASIREHGASLGGILEPEPLRSAQAAFRAGAAFMHFLALAALTFPAFWCGYVLWWQPQHSFQLDFGPAPLEELAAQVLMTALPEELFYRGYLQSALDRAWPPKIAVFGARIGAGLLISSVIFALGHVATQPHPSRLAVFFPSLLFGWLRARSGGLGAAILYHAACNVVALLLARSYGLAG